jgi:hypothetical protein
VLSRLKNPLDKLATIATQGPEVRIVLVIFFLLVVLIIEEVYNILKLCSIELGGSSGIDSSRVNS